MYDDDSTELGKRSEPAGKPRLIEPIASVTNEQRFHPESPMPGKCLCNTDTALVFQANLSPEGALHERKSHLWIPLFHSPGMEP
jgi:hypothetical protein